MKFLKDIFTDNEGDGDIVSTLAALALVVYLLLTVYVVVWKDKDLNGSDFAIAVTTLIGTLGGAYHWKSNKFSATEKKDQ